MAYLLHQLLSNAVNNDNNKIAVREDKKSITYLQLDQASQQLAYALIHAGVKRGDRVGIYLDKSIAAVISIFGILKAGAVYVPLDVAAPIQRINTIVNNAEIKVLMGTEQTISALLDGISHVQTVILMDEEASQATFAWSKKTIHWHEVLKSTPITLPAMIENDLAYILYTSGSTGVPKGVMISHRASLTFVNWSCDTFSVTATDVISSHAPFHFDLSIFDIFTTIKAGATIVLFSKESSMFPIQLAKLIADEKITIWYSVPSILTKLVAYGKLERFDFSALRCVLFAGEVFPIKYLQQLISFIPQAHYYNLYGPTETNVCTYYKVLPEKLTELSSLPIGQACANSEVMVLNAENQLVTPGEEGELCVRGPGLMTGYWGLPEKTAEVLVPKIIHPAIGEETIYHTGDFVRKNADGHYLYVGRRDNMVKSRGYRIELTEIEVVLYRHPNIEKVAVIAIPDEEHSNILKAFIVLQDNALEISHAEREFKSFCSNHLPRYMIPQIFEFRTSLPHTSTGKIDITQLKQEIKQ